MSVVASTGRRWLRLAAAGVFLTGAAGLVACGDDGDDETDATTPAAVSSPTSAPDDEEAAAIEQTMRDGIAAWNSKSAEAFLALFTDKAVTEIFGEGEPAAREDIAVGLPNFIGEPPLELRTLTTEADTDTGSAEVLWVSAPFLEHIRFAMIQEAGAWKIDGQDYLDVDVPDGTTMVDVEASEFAFGVVVEDIDSANAAGPIGFDINNAGSQEHHFALAKLPAEGDVQELLMTEEDVPGMEFIGFTEPIQPGDRNRAFVLIDSLESGRYAMVCFLPDTTEGAEGTPHAFKGMVQEFTIP